MNSLYAFDKLSSIRVAECLIAAIEQLAIEVADSSARYIEYAANPPKRKPGFLNFWRWLFDTEDAEKNYDGVLYFWKISNEGYDSDLTALVAVKRSLAFSPQYVALDQKTLDLIGKYIDGELIKSRKVWLENLLNNVK